MQSGLKYGAILSALGYGMCVAGCSHATGVALPPADENQSSRRVALESVPNASYRGIYSFGKLAHDGSGPFASLVALNGVFYGTTSLGGANKNGTVFSVTTSGKEIVRHNFNSSDGSQPGSELLYFGGMLYGTTRYGGAHNEGTFYRVSPTGAFTLLHSFSETDQGGDQPVGGLVALNGKFYGTASEGGSTNGVCGTSGIVGCGTVFSVTPSGVAHVLHTFHGQPDGSGPTATLTVVNGVLYGTTENGGKGGSGMVFRITTIGKETVVHSFNDGSHPDSGVLYRNGLLFGVTPDGGPNAHGTIFSLSLDGTETTLYTFGGGADGCSPNGLVSLKGKLYGTTVGASTYRPCPNAGTVYQYSSSTGLTTLYTFKSGKGGASPYDFHGLTSLNGKLYGTTWSGGNYDAGTVFSVSP